MRCFSRALALMAVFAISAVANADTLTFDDLTTPLTFVPSVYGGLAFSYFSVNTLSFEKYYGYNGYTNGTVSPSSVIWGAGGTPNPTYIAALPGSTFELNSFELTAAINDGLNVTLYGSNSGTLLYSTTFTVSTFSPTLETLNWSGLDKVSFSASGGTQDPLTTARFSAGPIFVIDNLTVNGSVAITPEPSSIFLLGSGLLVAFGATYWRQVLGRSLRLH